MATLDGAKMTNLFDQGFQKMMAAHSRTPQHTTRDTSNGILRSPSMETIKFTGLICRISERVRSFILSAESFPIVVDDSSSLLFVAHLARTANFAGAG